MELQSFHIHPYIEAGNIVCPEIKLSYEKGKTIGIYTDAKRVQYLLRNFMKQQNTYVHVKEDALYRNLTVKEHIKFFKRLYGSKEPVESLLMMVGLDNIASTRVKNLTKSEYQLLQYIRFYLNSANTLILEEPLQNIEEYPKQLMIKILENLPSKMTILLSNNLEDLLISCNEVYRLDVEGLRQLDTESQDSIGSEPVNTLPMKVDKIPTKKNDKIILFNPPEIDYIESVEGDVHVYVGGEAYPCALTLTDLENRLMPLGFFRCHRSYIVNLQKVREIITWTRNSYSLSIHTTTNTTVPLSKNKLPILKKLIGI